VTPYLLADGRRVVPESINRPWLSFRLQLPVREIRLISGSARPVELDGTTDRRRLGVLLRAARWTHDGETIEVPVDSPAFTDGFHGVEIHNPAAGPVRWSTGNGALPRALFPPWHGEAVLHLSLGEWRGTTQGIPPSTEEIVLSEFESLGEDCEFSLAQKHYQTDLPLSLFRWGGTPVDNLILGLGRRFAGLGEIETTEMIANESYYYLRTPYLTLHTNVRVDRDNPDIPDELTQWRGTLRLLRRKLLSDIEDGRRIFVFKSLDPTFGEIEMLRLHAALRRIGPAGLLCVTIAGPGQAIGGALHRGDGLYIGYLERFGLNDGPFDQWPSVCRETLALRARLNEDRSHGG
jgi:hypothetical protein